MPTGTIKNIVTDRGFGFIVPDKGGADVFFHARDLRDGLEFGEQLRELHVSYEMKIDDRTGKPRATDVRPAN